MVSINPENWLFKSIDISENEEELSIIIEEFNEKETSNLEKIEVKYYEKYNFIRI